MIPDLFYEIDPGIQSLIRSYCGWHIAPMITEVVTVDGSGGPVLRLPTLQLVNVVSISNHGRAVSAPEWSRTGVVRCGGRWTDRYGGVVAEITHGFEVCPDELLAAAERIGRTERMSGLGTVRIGQVSVQAEAPQVESPALDPYVTAILDRYRVHWAD